MPKRYFQKELPSQPVFVNGFPLRFDILETEDSGLITELDKCVRHGIGGVIALTQEQFEIESKKKQDANLSGSNSNPQQWRKELVAPHFQERSAAGAAGSFAKPQQPPAVAPQVLNPQPHEMPDPLTIPSPESLKIPKPPTAKLNKPSP